MNTLRSPRAFTLTEILVSLSIGVAVLGTLFVALRPAYDRAQAAILLKRARDYGNLIRAGVSNGTIPDPIPLTRPLRNVPLSGTYLADLKAAGSGSVVLGADYAKIMLTLHLIETWKEPPYNSSVVPPTWWQYVVWDTATNTFNADSMPAAERVAFEAAASAVNSPLSRIVSSLSTTAAPSASNGTNFWFGRGGDLPVNSRVIAWRLPSVPASFAEALAKAANPPEFRPASGAACDYGPVTYPAPDASGTTTVCVYIIHFP